jgi:hypothetical protein
MLTSFEGAAPADASAEHKALTATIVASMRSMPMESWMAKLMEAVQPVIEFAGTEFPVGETLEVESEVTALNGAVLPRNMTVELQRVAGGRAHFETIDTADPAALTAMMSRLFEQMAAAGGVEDRKELGEIKGASQVRRSAYRLSLEDGLLESYRLVDTTEFTTSAGTERKSSVTTIERMKVE